MRIPPHRRAVGHVVRRYRDQAGLSQEKLAEKADLSAVFISQVERGVGNASLDTLHRIARALGVRLRDLVADV